MTIKETAEYLGCDERFVEFLLEEGFLKSTNIDDLEAYKRWCDRRSNLLKRLTDVLVALENEGEMK